MTHRILVTGATGNVGREVMAVLRGRDVELRVGSRDVIADEQQNSGAEHIFLDLTDPASYASAVTDCDAVFLLRPPAVANTKKTLNVFIESAREAGVKRIVFISVAGAGDNRMVPHHAVEQKLRSGPKDWTILRPGFFAQNLATAYRTDIVEDDRIYVPAENGLVAWIDLRDVAVVAADALVDLEHHAGETYTLTGPVANRFDEVAAFLSLAVSRPIRYDPATILGYFRHLRHTGLATGQAFVQLVLHVGLRYGQAEEVNPTLERLLGYRPHDVEEYIHDHAHIWMNSS